MNTKWGKEGKGNKYSMKRGSVLVAVLVIMIFTAIILSKLWFLLAIRLKGYP